MKYALRTLWKDRGFAAMAVLSLAVGIGANTAIFSLVSGVLLRPLDFPDPQRLVAISISTPQFRNGEPLPINLGQLVEWRKRTHSFESIGAYRNTTMSLTGDGRPELIPGAQVSANFFDVLGVQSAFRPLVSRAGGPLRAAPGGDACRFDLAAPVRRRSRRSSGRKITLGGAPYTVVGVLPPDFEFPKQPSDIGKRLNGRMEMFRPLGYEPDDIVPHDGDLNYAAIARLRPGVSIERARAELTAAEAAIDAQIGGESWHMVPVDHAAATEAHRRCAAEPDRADGGGRRGAAGALRQSGEPLAFARGRTRARSRDPHGARSEPMAAGAAIAGGNGRARRAGRRPRHRLRFLGIATAAGRRAHRPAAAARRLGRWPRAAFRAGVSAITALLFGILPALRSASSGAPYETLKSTSYANAGGPAGLRLRNLLVALEVGLCAALLVTAGLFLSSFVRLTTIPRGFDIERVLAVDVALPGTKYAKDADVTRFFETVLEQARALPGVESAAISSYLPLQGESWIDIVKTENDARPESQLPTANLRFISPGYFRTLHIPLRAGRDFEACGPQPPGRHHFAEPRPQALAERRPGGPQADRRRPRSRGGRRGRRRAQHEPRSESRGHAVHPVVAAAAKFVFDPGAHRDGSEIARRRAARGGLERGRRRARSRGAHARADSCPNRWRGGDSR